MATIGNPTRWAVAAALLLTYLVAGLYPFAWQAPEYTVHNAAIRGVDGALLFTSPGIALGALGPEWLSEAIDARRLGLTLDVQTDVTPPHRTARIFALSDEEAGRNFVVDQHENDLVVRVRGSGGESLASTAYRFAGALSGSGRKRISVEFSHTILTVGVDDSEMVVVTLDADPFLEWSASSRVAFGNSLRFNRPWSGEIHRAQVHGPSGTIDYLADELVRLPPVLTLRRNGSRMNLQPFARSEFTAAHIFDWTLNLVGFMPLGFCIALWRGPRRSLLVATLASAALSIGIENLQCYLDGRNAAIDDVLLNTLGGFFGACLARTRLAGAL